MSFLTRRREISGLQRFQSNTRDDSLEEIPLLFDEMRETYGSQIDEEQQINSFASPVQGNAESAFEEHLQRLHDVSACNSSCATCSKQVRVENVQSFRKGQHVAMPGNSGRKYVSPIRKLISAYQHHAIIKEVMHCSGTRVKMELIHFTKEEEQIQIYKTQETYDLTNDEIMIVQYDHPRYTADEIVERAENILQANADRKTEFQKYNLLMRNCEHFATWCVVGEGKSFQVLCLREKIGEGLKKVFGEGSNIAKGILRLLFISSDEIAGAMTRAINVPEIVLGGAAALYLIYCIVRTVTYIKEYKSGHMCWSCLKGKLIDLWATFGVFGATSVVTYLIFHFALPLLNPAVGIPLMILLILLSALLQWSVPKIRKALQSPFNADKVNIKTLSELNIGDVVALRYYGLEHIMILTEVHEENGSSTVGKIRCVHYGLRNMFANREIIEEYFPVNLSKAAVRRLDCQHLLCHPGDVVVRRARKRIGETKWAASTNRSDHFSFWAKVRQRPRGECREWDQDDLEPSKTTTLSSLTIGKSEVHLMDEIQVGDVLEHERTGILASCVSLDGGNGREFEIEIIFFDHGWIIRSKKYKVDLSKDKIYIKKFHPAHCHPMERRVERARNWLGKKGPWWSTDSFIAECVMLKP